LIDIIYNSCKLPNVDLGRVFSERIGHYQRLEQFILEKLVIEEGFRLSVGNFGDWEIRLF